MTAEEIKAANDAKAAAAHDELINKLRATTALGRLNHAELRAIATKAAEFGWSYQPIATNG